MNEFIEYFESKGIRNIKNLTAFVHDLRQEPVIFLELTESERNEMEQKFDEALALFKDWKLFNLQGSEFKEAGYPW